MLVLDQRQGSMMGRKANYQDIGGPTGKLARLEPFEGNSMRAAWVMPAEDDVEHAASYRVWSYDTQIAMWSQDGIHVSDTHYSTTTSRHQNLCRTWLGTKAYMNDDAKALGLI